MSKPPKYWNKAKKILSKRDPILKKIIKKLNKGYLTSKDDPFFSLCRTIVGQQISIKAADSIWLKFEIKCRKKIIPSRVLKLSSTGLKSAGLSRQKITYLKNIARAFTNPDVQQPVYNKETKEFNKDFLEKAGFENNVYRINPISNRTSNRYECHIFGKKNN